MKQLDKPLKLLLLLAITAGEANAQLTSNYPSSNAVVVTGGTYVDLGSNGTAITTATTDNDLSAATPIGFTFDFNGASYTDFVLSTNGFIKLGTLAPSANNIFYSTGNGIAGGVFNNATVADSSIIAPFACDLEGAAGVEYRVYTSGSPGSQVCTIQFKNVSDKSTAAPAKQYSEISFQIRLYETTNVIEFIYGSAAATANTSAFKTAAVGLRGNSNAANQLVTVTKGSTQTWDLATFLNGNYTGNAFNFGNNVVTNRPLPLSGVVYRFIPVYPLDMAVRQIYTLGKMPLAYATPHFIRAAVKNSGTLPQSNIYVRLFITGANTFTDSVLITGIDPGVDTIITFAAFTPGVNGTNNIEVSFPADININNDTRFYTQEGNDVVYSYADPAGAAAGGVGFTGATGDFVAKFPYSGVPNAVNQVGVNFFGGGISLRIGIWSRNIATGLPGTLLWQSAQFTTVTGLNTIPVVPAIAVSDTFFVGVIQNTTNNANFSFQNEDPIRNQTFFYTSPTGNTVWTDFFATASAFRFMIEPRLQSPNDVGFTSIDHPCTILPVGQSAFAPVATMFNYGTLVQSGVPVTCEIYDQSNMMVYSSTSATGTVNSGLSDIVTFPATFSTGIPGNYTVKVWSSLAGDASTANDTAVSTLQIVSTNAVSDAGIRLQFDGADDQIQIRHSSSLSLASSLTLSAWVNIASFAITRPVLSKDESAVSLSYSLSVNTLGQPVFTLNTSSGAVVLTSSMSMFTNTWTHLTATYDGNDMRLYINGDLAGVIPQSGSVVSNTAQLLVGRSASLGTFLNGGIDELKIWNITLSEAEIRTMLHYRDSDFSSPNLICYLRMDEGVNSFLTVDASGNCNSGTLVNMDVANATLSPAWFFSTIPLGQPVVATTGIASSGLFPLTGTDLSLTTYNYSGSEEYYVHVFDTVPSGTTPLTIPGTVTTVYPRNWIIYRYGSATYDSIYAEFSMIAGSITPLALDSDISLFYRGNGSNGGWTLYQNPASMISTTPGTATFKFTGSTQFGRQFSIGANNNPLPVKMLYFTGRNTGGDVSLKWATSSEKGNAGFIIERSTDGKKFTRVTYVKGKGNSNEMISYTTVDAKAFAVTSARTLYYRLIQGDVNGNREISNTIRVSIDKMMINDINLYPNPFTDEISLNIDVASVANAKLIIMDLAGRKVYEKELPMSAGENNIKTSGLDQLPEGMYLLELTVNGETAIHKLLKH